MEFYSVIGIWFQTPKVYSFFFFFEWRGLIKSVRIFMVMFMYKKRKKKYRKGSHILQGIWKYIKAALNHTLSNHHCFENKVPLNCFFFKEIHAFLIVFLGEITEGISEACSPFDWFECCWTLSQFTVNYFWTRQLALDFMFSLLFDKLVFVLWAAGLIA